jgi:large subunit ribosomal protein L21
MEPYAVVEASGRQFLVKAGDTLEMNRLAADKGATVNLAPVLAISDGKALKVGKPEIKGAKVVCSVLEHKRGVKVVSFKKKRRKGYERKIGHRQELTVLKVESLG